LYAVIVGDVEGCRFDAARRRSERYVDRAVSIDRERRRAVVRQGEHGAFRAGNLDRINIHSIAGIVGYREGLGRRCAAHGTVAERICGRRHRYVLRIGCPDEIYIADIHRALADIQSALYGGETDLTINIVVQVVAAFQRYADILVENQGACECIFPGFDDMSDTRKRTGIGFLERIVVGAVDPGRFERS